MKKELDLQDTVWDVAVIGGGPAGMMAAGRAAERGLKVVLLEKNPTLGKKLLITGGGRCNVTNAEPDVRKLLAKFKDSDKYLFSAFSKWSVKETLDFFHIRKLDTKVEAEQRVFPITDKAQSVWNVLVDYMKQTGVTILPNCEVMGFVTEESKVTGVKLKGRNVVTAKSFILATGGKSHPETGSTGEGFVWLKTLGHKVIEPTASLVPVTLRDVWVRDISGVSLQNIKLTLTQAGVKHKVVKGKILFTHFGITGPTVLNMSSDVRELLKYGEVTIALDLLPTLDHGMLNKKLQDIFKENINKKFKNSLSPLITPALAPIIIELSKIDPEKQSNSITREERLRLIDVLKNIPLHVSGLLGVDKAIVTSGGVSLDEIDFKTMSSKLYPNLYLVGDVLNIDRPSGGYSLQLCWTTGFVAGDSAGK